MLDQIRASADLVSVISQHVALKRVGKNFVGLCPFHREKSPSFNVNPHKQFYKCYGCGEGGDVISFMRKTTGMGFPEAVRELARQFHVSLPEEDQASRQKATERDLLHQVNAWAAGFFEKALREGPGWQYLLSRGLDEENIRAFRLGWAPDEWEACRKAAQDAGFGADLLERAGLVLPGKEGRGHYDRFRGRVVFPIFDPQGRALGFGARTLGDETPKYLNSPTTEVFSKGRALYALDRAAQAIRDQGRVAVMEGYTDVIRAHQAGVTWAVATLGTALTAEHAMLLKRYTDQVILVYDADAAGKKAADRGLDVLLQQNFLVRVCTLPEGEDPCDFFGHATAKDFEARVAASSEELVDYRIEQARRQGRFATVKEQGDVLAEILVTAASIPDEARRELVVKRVSEKTGVSEAALLRQLHRKGGKAAGSPARAAEPSAPVRPAPRPSAAMEQALLSVLIQDPMIVRGDSDLERMSRLVLENEALSAPFRAAFLTGIAVSAEGVWDPQRLVTALAEDEDAKGLVLEAWGQEMPSVPWAQVWKDCLVRLERMGLEAESQGLRGNLADPEAFRKLVEARRRMVSKP